MTFILLHDIYYMKSSVFLFVGDNRSNFLVEGNNGLKQKLIS